jgi:hypothetical protein
VAAAANASQSHQDYSAWLDTEECDEVQLYLAEPSYGFIDDASLLQWWKERVRARMVDI